MRRSIRSLTGSSKHTTRGILPSHNLTLFLCICTCELVFSKWIFTPFTDEVVK
uniref:Uncharacterized protein n=1 Tax=Rhizophora mucronata TaxID=61149 RepID=A0A2P2Q792_RHIMU